MELGLRGKVAIVTGGSEGIGRETARVLATEGAKVVIAARRLDRLEEVAAELGTATGGEVIAVRTDVSVGAEVQALVAETVRRFGRLDVLINNAGGSRALPFEQATDQDWQDDLNLKLFASIHAIRAAIPHLKQAGGGSIVNLLNIAAKAPPANSVPTSVTRAAGLALTKSLSKEYAPFAIRVNAVLIGLVKSAQHDKKHDATKESRDAFYARMAKDRAVPLGREGETEEAANVVAFLASPRSAFVTGVAINVDGGASPVV